MKIRWFLKYALPVFIIALFASGVVLAQGYAMNRGTVAGGGHIFSTNNGSYSLGGTIGQPVVGAMSGDPSYTLGSGFWSGGALSSSVTYPVYLPIILENYP
jgi:hypothetical protein